MQRDPHALQIEVDGSRQKDRRAGYAGLATHPRSGIVHEIFSKGFRENKNNRMELGAVVAALEWVREAKPPVSRVQVFTDSLEYVYNNIPRAPGWKSRGWRNTHGRPIENSDLWDRFLAARRKAGVRVDFGWVPRRSTPTLQRVDDLAKDAAKSGTEIDLDYRTGKVGRAVRKGTAKPFPAEGDVVVIRVCGTRTVGKLEENKVTFELYDEGSGEVGNKYHAYAQPEVGANLHRQRYFRVQMNDNPKYPQVVKVMEELPLTKGKKAASTIGESDPVAVES